MIAAAERSRKSAHAGYFLRATATAFIVGPLLVLINQTPALARLLDGEMLPRVAMIRISLTFVVPFLVSLTSSASADAQRSGSE